MRTPLKVNSMLFLDTMLLQNWQPSSVSIVESWLTELRIDEDALDIASSIGMAADQEMNRAIVGDVSFLSKATSAVV